MGKRSIKLSDAQLLNLVKELDKMQDEGMTPYSKGFYKRLRNSLSFEISYAQELKQIEAKCINFNAKSCSLDEFSDVALKLFKYFYNKGLDHGKETN